MTGLKRKAVEQPPPEVLFSQFQSLVQAIADIEPKPTGQSKPASNDTAGVFRRWITSLGSSSTPRTGLIVFRLLFPESDNRRRYDLKETRLAKHLATCLEVPTNEGTRGHRLKNWTEDGSSGCLGDEVRRVMMLSPLVTPVRSISLSRVDELLDELALHSPFSELRNSSNHQPRPQMAIISDLYSTLNPSGAAVMTQIILQDLRPLLYPPPTTRSRANLIGYNSNSFQALTVPAALRLWDPLLPQIFKVRATLEDAFETLATLDSTPGHLKLGPSVGTQVQIPKCIKAQGCKNAIDIFSGPGGSRKVWAETKYDGERMQIHVDLLESGPNCRIFSKSGRDSTIDRIATHSIIESALGLPLRRDDDPRLIQRAATSKSPQNRVSHSVILEAEMVCYNEKNHQIDEFWRIRSLIEYTSEGARARFRRRNYGNSSRAQVESQDDAPEYDESLKSNGTDHGHRHFMLVFFDILALDGQNLLNSPYRNRREKLEGVIREIPGYSALAKRNQVDLSRQDAVEQLQSIFSECLANHEEGLVLKPDYSTYNAMAPASRWIKMKADYIPGLGDTVDLAVIGACWEKERGRTLRVTPSTMTTFFLAALDKDEERRRGSRARPHLEVLFYASYGLSREQLEEFNWEIQQSPKYEYEPNQLRSLSYTFTLPAGFTLKPTVLFAVPKLVEVFGAGFTKSPGARYYELRFPRITKVWRLQERQWMDGVNLQRYQEIACEAIGRDTPQKQSKDVVNSIWKQPTSPGAKSAVKRQERQQKLLRMLEKADNHGRSPKQGLKLVQGLTREERNQFPSPQRSRKALGTSTNVISRCSSAHPIGIISPSNSKNTVSSSASNQIATVSPSESSATFTTPNTPITPLINRLDLPTNTASSASVGLGSPSVLSRYGNTSSPPTSRLSASVSGKGCISKENFAPNLFVQNRDSPKLAKFHNSTPPQKSSTWTLQASLFFVHPPTAKTKLDLVRQPSISPEIQRTFQDQRVRSLEALLWGTGWRGPCHAPPRFGKVERGFIFIDDSDGDYLKEFISALKHLSPRAKDRRDIHVFPMHTLASFYSSASLPVSAIPLWSSM
ncbi:hypothetical protein FRC03_012710 [Tulasnella sp. 419]|nr:hypothetical protein FRC03_012710 [Tulasnella sp. 419]